MKIVALTRVLMADSIIGDGFSDADVIRRGQLGREDTADNGLRHGASADKS